MNVILNQTHQTIGDFEAIFDLLLKELEGSFETPTLKLFPELFLTGYPLQDLVLQKIFITKYQNFLKRIEGHLLSLKKNSNLLFLVGGLHYQFDSDGLPLSISNVIFKVAPGEPLRPIYSKRLLPNYDIFDEHKYFTPGSGPNIIEFNGCQIALMICEDMWPSSMHPVDPTDDLAKLCNERKITLDLIVNLSASPWHIGKIEQRLVRAYEVSKKLCAPLAWVNRVGSEDEIIFDGQSFVVEEGKAVAIGQAFVSDKISYPLPQKKESCAYNLGSKKSINTWESLFTPRLTSNKKGELSLTPLTESECQEILHAIKLGILDYAKKSNLKEFIVASSGGLDSALVLTIMRLIIDDPKKIESVFMPGQFSSGLSYDLAQKLAGNLGIRHYNYPIKFLHSTVRNSFNDAYQSELTGIADENIQSRMRGALLYARANLKNSMVINTSNKSEIGVGYSTQYGDAVGAISMLGDLYKSDVFTLANYINKKHGKIIPEEIITRPPTAELKENQTDEASLLPYNKLDTILEALLSYKMSLEEIIAGGFTKEEVDKVFRLYKNSEFKRRQFCPILKLQSKSFGFGYRVPICKIL